MSRRLSSRLVGLIIVGSLLAGVAGVAVMIRMSADAAWEGLRARTAALAVEAQASLPPRIVLRGTPEPGNGLAEFEAASRRLEKLNGRHLQVFVWNDRTDNRSGTEEHVAEFETEIALFRLGVGRAEGAWSIVEIHDPLAWYQLGVLVLAKAKILHEAGKPEVAAAMILDVMQLCGDRRRTAGLSISIDALGLLEIALSEFISLLTRWPARGEALAGVERELEILDRTWVTYSTTLRNETLCAHSALLGADPPPFRQTWRYGFSGRLMAAAAGGEIIRYREESLRHEARPWPEQVAEWKTLWEAFEKDANPLNRDLLAADPHYSTTVRECRAQLRLIRMQVHYRARGKLEALQDPFGTVLRHVDVGDKVKVWSVGEDGIDQGGLGEWPFDEPGHDIVLEFAK